MAILLVRHAESLGNADSENYLKYANHELGLTDKGHAQAGALGLFLKEWYHANPPHKNVRLWCSPYRRTFQTLQGMRETMGEWAWNKCGRGRDIHFDERLRERDWGYYRYNDYHRENNEKIREIPEELREQYMIAYKAPMGRYFARPVGGESLADVADRMRSFHQDLFFDIQNGVTDHVIVMHAAAMMAFVYAFTKTHPYFMTDEKFPENTGVRLLDIDPATQRYADYGMIYNPESNVFLSQRPPHPVPRDMNVVLSAK